MFESFTRWFFLLWGAVVASLQIHALWRGWRARRWPAVAGHILDADVRYHRARHGGYLPEVRYRYVVDAETFVADRLRFGGRTLRSERAARAALRGVEPGVAAAVRYNPWRSLCLS